MLRYTIHQVVKVENFFIDIGVSSPYGIGLPVNSTAESSYVYLYEAKWE